MRWAVVALVLISSPAMGGEIPPCTVTMNCTEVWKSPGPAVKVEPAAIDACQADNERLSAINGDLLNRVAALEKIIAEKKPEPAKAHAPATGKRRLPCKKGRTRNAQGICGRWK